MHLNTPAALLRPPHPDRRWPASAPHQLAQEGYLEGRGKPTGRPHYLAHTGPPDPCLPAVSHPSAFPPPQVYEAKLAEPLTPAQASAAAKRFAAGTLVLQGDTLPLLPAALTMVDPSTARLAICEGRYHQVRGAVHAPLPLLPVSPFTPFNLPGLSMVSSTFNWLHQTPTWSQPAHPRSSMPHTCSPPPRCAACLAALAMR